MPILWRSFDGQRLLDDGMRHNVRSEVCMMLQALVDGGGVAAGQRLALVLTKQDVVLNSDLRERAGDDFNRILTKVQSLFGHVFSEIRAFPVAASPQAPEVRRGSGIAELLSFWLKPSIPIPMAATEPPEFERAYARLTLLDE